MGSQTLEILRQGVWASLTGGWFYDPRQNVFCNAVHLYLWLFLLCSPFVTYLYFPKTLSTWGLYCVTTACTMTVLKIVNMALHALYDKSQTMSDPNLKKPLKSLKESEGEDECGIEMQVLGTDAPSAVSVEQPSEDNSGANSYASLDCQEHVTSTIDLKVDVHRKNSSESSDSVNIYPPGSIPSTTIPSYTTDVFPGPVSRNHSLKIKSKSEERPSKNPSISEEIQDYDNENELPLPHGPDTTDESLDPSRSTTEIHSKAQQSSSNATGSVVKSIAIKNVDKKRRMKNRLQRQSSLDASRIEVVRYGHSYDIDGEPLSSAGVSFRKSSGQKLQRHRSTESNQDVRTTQSFSYHHQHIKPHSSDMRHRLQSLASDFYLEKNYTKSDFGIENIAENDGTKMFSLQQTNASMRKDSNSTMSALQLPVAASHVARKRRNSNTVCKTKELQLHVGGGAGGAKPLSSVRRIKSAALEISCPQPSISNLSAHPNSVETIAGQQLRNPQNAVLPPPSKSLIRPPHLNLCPKIGSITNNSNSDAVYPIAEQADERSIHEGFVFGKCERERDLESGQMDGHHKRSSTTESESDCERPRTLSTDSDTENNGSQSPLLYKKNSSEEKYKGLSVAVDVGGSAPTAIGLDVPSKSAADSGGPSSDCEHVSASSKDMLLGRHEKQKLQKSDENQVAAVEETIRNNYSEIDTNPKLPPRNSGAIPKVLKDNDKGRGDYHHHHHRHRHHHSIAGASSLGVAGAIPKSASSRASSSASSRSFSAESFEYTRPQIELFQRTSREQWIVLGGGDHHAAAALQSGDVIFNNSRRLFLDSNYRMAVEQTKLRSASESVRRSSSHHYAGSHEAKMSKIDAEIIAGIEFSGPDVLQNCSTSIINEQYPFEKSANSSSEQRTNNSAIVNLSRIGFGDSAYCDYWRSNSLSAEKPVQPKRFYKYPLPFFGRRELKIAMDRLQLLALFDRDLDWLHVIMAIMLSATVCLMGSVILEMGVYKDIWAFLFCIVIAGSQYSLLKSVQPDAASPIHGFNKTVAYSRPIYFCLCSALLVFSHHLAKEFAARDASSKDLKLFGLPFSPEAIFDSIAKLMSILILLFPVFFSLGLFPQINTFVMYILEQIDMHIFGGSAACSLSASILCILKSLLAVSLVYGPAYGGLIEKKGTQHVLFSIFCAVLIPVCYHLSRSASDFTHLWALIKSNLVISSEDEETNFKKSTSSAISENQTSKENQEVNAAGVEVQLNNKTEEASLANGKETEQARNTEEATTLETPTMAVNLEPPDPLPKKLQGTVNSRLKNDLLVSSVLAVLVLGLHCSTVFTVLQPDLNVVLYSIAGILGFIIHYVIPQTRKHLPWLCFAMPILKQKEFGKFEVFDAAKVMWFEKTFVILSFLERNVLYPLIFISALTADSSTIVAKYGVSVGTLIVTVCALKCVRNAYSDSGSQYLILTFAALLFRVDFNHSSETFLIDFFFVSIIFKKSCEFLLKIQFIVTYIAPWQITWGSAFHAFAQPFSVPHSAMLFLQAALSAVLSTPLNPFLGSAIFLTSYVRPIKFWERDYNTRRIDHSNTRLSSQLERDLGADDNNLNSIFYEHLTRSLQHSLCGDILLGRWGNVSQGDCFVLASDYLNCLVHVIELGNGLCTFQMRGLEFRGTYCQQREVEAISEGVEDNDGCCCCAPGHLPRMLSANAMFSTRWLAWQVVASQYVLEGYSISENLATATLQVFEFRKVLISYYMKSIIYYTIRSAKLNEWLAPGPIQEALQSTLSRQFVDLDPIFNYNLDEDFDFRALGITRASFCAIYLDWIQFCDAKRNNATTATIATANTGNADGDDSNNVDLRAHQPVSTNKYEDKTPETPFFQQTEEKAKKKILESSNISSENGRKNDQTTSAKKSQNNVTKDSALVSLCLALGLLARRSLATASHSSLSGVEFFLHGLHALFKGDFRITSPRDEWVFGDMELLHGVVSPAVKMALKLHQDHFSSPDEYLDPTVLYEAISSHSKDLVISHEADPIWRSAVLRGAQNLLALRHVMEDGSDEYRIIRLTKRFLSFRVIKLNRECVRGLWAGQQQELIYLRNRNPERGSIQNAKQALRNIINSSCDQPIGYPIYVSPLITSYAETNEQLCSIVGGSLTLEKIRCLLLDGWRHVRQRCREGCSSGSGGLDCDINNDIPAGVYFSPTTGTNAFSGTAGTLSYGSQSLSGAGTRGSLACINKPTSSTLLAGLLNRERDQDREAVRDRGGGATGAKKQFQTKSDRELRCTLPIASETNIASANCRDLVLRETMGSNNSGLKLYGNIDQCGTENNDGLIEMRLPSKISFPSGNLDSASAKYVIGGSVKFSIDRMSSEEQDETSEFLGSINDTRSWGMGIKRLIELDKKVIIVDGMEIYDCLDLGRRIDVVWPSEQMRSSGGKSSWKDWSPREGMVGYVVHYWQPNHSDPRFRSNVNRILYLVAIGDNFVPVGESGIREYNQQNDGRIEKLQEEEEQQDRKPQPEMVSTSTNTVDIVEYDSVDENDIENIPTISTPSILTVKSTESSDEVGDEDDDEDQANGLGVNKIKISSIFMASCTVCDSETQTEFIDKEADARPKQQQFEDLDQEPVKCTENNIFPKLPSAIEEKGSANESEGSADESVSENETNDQSIKQQNEKLKK